MLAHNVPFDRGFVCAELRRAGCQPLPNPWVDTLTLARKYLPQLPNRRLATVAQHFGISTAGHHRAMADALMVAGIFAKLNSLDDSPPGQGIGTVLLLPSSISGESRRTVPFLISIQGPFIAQNNGLPQVRQPIDNIRA